MNALEKVGLKAGWKYMEVRMPWLKRWGPVISTGVLAITVAIRIAGKFGLIEGADQTADAIDTVTKAVGLSADAELVAQVGLLTAAVAGAGTGIVLKVRSQIQKAKAS